MKKIATILLLLGFRLVYAQPNTLESSTEESYWAQEKLFVHTDKSVYVVGETLWFALYCRDKFYHVPSQLSKVAYLELKDKDAQSLIQEKVSLKGSMGKGQLYISPQIPSGIYLLTAYTHWMRNEGPDAFFQQEICIVNPRIPPKEVENSNPSPQIAPLAEASLQTALSFSISKSQLKHREKLELTLTPLPDDIGPARLSLSVYKTDPHLNFAKPTLTQTYSNSVPSNLNGEHPIPWDDFDFLPEPRTHILQGEFLDKDLSDIPIFLSIPGRAAELYALDGDENGYFSIEMAPHAPSGDIFIWSPEREIGRGNIRLISPYSEGPAASPMNAFPGPEWKSLLESYIYNAQVSHLYRDSLSRSAITQPTSFYQQPFYGIPRYSYLLDDYTRFPELEEVFLEYLRYALKRKVEGKRYVFIWDEYTNIAAMGNAIPFEKAALVLIDGIPIRNPEILWEFDVFDIQQIDLVTKAYYVKDYPFYGIANFRTYKHNFGGKQVPDDLLRMNYQGLLQSRTFFTPMYNSPEQRNNPIPDFRSTLYWNPSISLKDESLKVECWSSDDEGWYKIEINGISDTGIPLYGEAFLEVKRSL